MKGEQIGEYEGNLCTYKVFKEKEKYYGKMGMGSYILEYEQRWAIDATEENGTFGCLINHSKLNQNIKPVVEVKKGQPTIIFVALRDIKINEELLYDYCDTSNNTKKIFPWLKKRYFLKFYVTNITNTLFCFSHAIYLWLAHEQK